MGMVTMRGLTLEHVWGSRAQRARQAAYASLKRSFAVYVRQFCVMGVSRGGPPINPRSERPNNSTSVCSTEWLQQVETDISWQKCAERQKRWLAHDRLH